MVGVSPRREPLVKRNWDTIREILTRLEEINPMESHLELTSFSAERAAEISYHMELLIEAGLVEGQMTKYIGRKISAFFVSRLTWSGHEFLDAIRSNTVWEKTKKTIVSKGLALTFDLIKSVATDVAGSIIKSATGG
jgi:hypothetical protein